MSSEASSPAKIDPTQQAQDVLGARQATYKPMQDLMFNLFTDPYSGALPTSQYYKRVREEVMPEQTQLSNAFMQMLMQKLGSPEYLTPQEQELQTQGRNVSRRQLEENMRNRANLGGGLYGGRSAAKEAESRTLQESGFVESDIGNRYKNLSLLASMINPILQSYYGFQPQTMQFESPVVDPNQQYASEQSRLNTEAQIEMQNAANQAALQQQLLENIGKAGGAVAMMA